MDSIMAKLIIINGAPGVGKSTIAELLFSKLNNTALLDGDDVWRINPFEVTEKKKKIVESNIFHVLRNYIEAGYEYVILSWVLHKQEIIDRLLSKLNDLSFEVSIFTLIADEGVLLQRLANEKYNTRSKEIAIDRLRQSLQLDTIKIDTTEQRPKEIVEEIIKQIPNL